MRARYPAILATALAVLAGAGAVPAGAAAPLCLRGARLAIAKELHLRTNAVRTSVGQGTNGMPQCVFRARRATVTVNVDNGPQAGWRLMRKVVEATQIFGPPPPGWHAPIGLFGLGAYASWFINLDALMANNHDRKQLLTVTIDWRHAKRAAMIKLARTAVVPYRRTDA
jgi:hypothetical protein